MKDVIGVFNPFGLVQKAGKRTTHKRKTHKRKTHKRKTHKRKTHKRKTSKISKLFKFI